MAEESDFWSKLQYGLKNSPKSGNGFFDLARPLMWAMDRPTDFGRAGINLNEYFYNQAIKRGQNPMDAMPWLKGSSTSPVSAPNPDDKKYKGLAPWYVDWLKTSGVRGLL